MRLNMKPYLILMRFDRPIGFFLLLWPTYWALWLAAEGVPQLSLLLVFTLGVIIMRAAGCVINDIFDREVDPHVERTRHRPLATGELSVRSALYLFGILCLLALSLWYWLNSYTRWLSMGGVVLTLLYPLLKRYIHLPQLGLGLAFSWGIPMAFAAQTNHISTTAWVLYTINGLWTIAYDTEYAMADRNDDLKIGVKSTAILLANYDRLFIGMLQSGVIILLGLLSYQLNFNTNFSMVLIAGLLLFAYQQYLICDQEPQACLRAFRHNHWFGMVVFLGIIQQFSSGIVINP